MDYGLYWKSRMLPHFPTEYDIMHLLIKLHEERWDSAAMPITAKFRFSKWQPSPFWISEKKNILHCIREKQVILHLLVKFYKDQENSAVFTLDLDFSKWQPPTSWLLLTGTPTKCLHTSIYSPFADKGSWRWTNFYRIYCWCSFFKMAGAILDFRNLKI